MLLGTSVFIISCTATPGAVLVVDYMYVHGIETDGQ